jgi:hypothetical protein
LMSPMSFFSFANGNAGYERLLAHRPLDSPLGLTREASLHSTIRPRLNEKYAGETSCER